MKKQSAFNRLKLEPFTLICLAISVSALVGCATNSQDPGSKPVAVGQFDRNLTWREVEKESRKYVPVNLSTSVRLDYRNGGWLEAHGAEFFVLHDLPTKERNAIVDELLEIIKESTERAQFNKAYFRSNLDKRIKELENG